MVSVNAMCDFCARTVCAAEVFQISRSSSRTPRKDRYSEATPVGILQVKLGELKAGDRLYCSWKCVCDELATDGVVKLK